LSVSINWRIFFIKRLRKTIGRLLEQNDWPMLEGLKKLQGVSIHLLRREKDYPDRERLSSRFQRFRAAY